MQIAESFIRSLMDGLTYCAERPLDVRNHLVEDSNLVKTFITVPKDCKLIPLILLGLPFIIRDGSKELCPSRNVVVPLYEGYQETHRTTDSILKSLILPARAGRLTKVTTSKGEVFYGGKGVILEEDGTPILLIKVTYNRDPSHSGSRITDGELCISPKVFTMDNTVYKGILSKIVPVYTGLVDNHRSVKFRVVVEDIQGFSKPQLINHSIGESCRAANKFLRDNLENVFY